MHMLSCTPLAHRIPSVRYKMCLWAIPRVLLPMSCHYPCHVTHACHITHCVAISCWCHCTHLTDLSHPFRCVSDIRSQFRCRVQYHAMVVTHRAHNPNVLPWHTNL